MCGVWRRNKLTTQGGTTIHEDSAALTMEVEAVTRALRRISSRGDSQTTHAIILADPVSLYKTWKGKPRLECVDGRISTFETSWVYCPGHTGVDGNDRADRLAGKATITSGLRLGRSEVLRNLRHYLQAQSRGHHTIDHLEERGVERGSARRSSLKGRKKAIVSQTNIGTVSEALLRKHLSERRG